jgi:DNA-directed RNA polymerase alpha subunit
MTVWIYVNTSKQVGDKDHLKVFATEDAAETWLQENDPEGVAFEYEVIKVFLYPTPELPDNTPLECVRFSTRIRKALEFGGLKTVGEVRTASDAVLLSFQRLGRGSVQHLRQTLGPR